VGFGKAAEIAKRDRGEEAERIARLREKLISGLAERIEHIHLNGHPTRRLPNNINVSIELVEGESMILNLDLEGIAASTGSACSSGSLEPSHVLRAIGLSHELHHSSLRFSLGRETTEEEIERLLAILPPIVAKLRSMSPLLKSTLSEGARNEKAP
jgi:cysteine desulfurase